MAVLPKTTFGNFPVVAGGGGGKMDSSCETRLNTAWLPSSLLVVSETECSVCPLSALFGSSLLFFYTTHVMYALSQAISGFCGYLTLYH